VLRDQATEQVGSATQFVEIPDVGKGHLTLSGIVLSADALAGAKPADGASQEEGQVADQDPNGTPAVRIFKPGAGINYVYQILNAHAGTDRKPELEVQTHLFRDGKQVYADNPVPMQFKPTDDIKRLLGSGRIQFGRIPDGDYVLQVIVTDKLAKDKYRVAAQSIDFEIRQGEK
jgi:hypothetical protein